MNWSMCDSVLMCRLFRPSSAVPSQLHPPGTASPCRSGRCSGRSLSASSGLSVRLSGRCSVLRECTELGVKEAAEGLRLELNEGRVLPRCWLLRGAQLTPPAARVSRQTLTVTQAVLDTNHHQVTSVPAVRRTTAQQERGAGIGHAPRRWPPAIPCLRKRVRQLPVFP